MSLRLNTVTQDLPLLLLMPLQSQISCIRDQQRLPPSLAMQRYGLVLQDACSVAAIGIPSLCGYQLTWTACAVQS